MGSNLEPIPITSQKHDPAWKHCEMYKNGERVQLKCVYCSKVFKGGGIHRIKEHLAGQKGNASTCLQVPQDVRVQMQQSLDGVVVKKRKKQKVTEEITNLNHACTDIEVFGNDNGDVNGGMELIEVSNAIEPCSSLLVSQEDGMRVKGGERRKRGRGRGRGRGSAVNENADAIVSVINSMGPMSAKRANDHIQMAIGRFLYDIGAPLNAVNSVYFQPMVDAIASGGSKVIAPSYHDLRGWILKDSFDEVKTDVDKHTMSWARTGCSVLVDQTSTGLGRVLLSFLVYCPEGVVFLKSVDASDIINSSDALYELLKQVVEDIGVQHVLQVITSMEEQYIVAGRRLADTFPTLYWAPCAAHCIDLILEDFTKLEWISSVIEQVRSITRFVYNRAVVLNMVRRYTFGNDIVASDVTRFAANFATLKRIVDLKHILQAMVTSQEWADCPYSKETGGLEMLDLISNQSFWSSCDLITHLTKPLLQVLRIVCSKERPAMAYVYAGIYRAKEAIKRKLIKREEYVVYWNIIDHWWEQQRNLRLQAAGFYLNPKFFYSIDEDMRNDIFSVMVGCIDKFVPDANIQDKIVKEINSYKDATGDFGRKMAVRARDTLIPAEWWSTYGGSCPNLVRFAIRILSQTCSSIGYKQDHISCEQIHDTRNSLERQRLSDLIFVQYNLRLRQTEGKKSEQELMDPISFDSDSILNEWVKGKEMCFDDYANADWKALNPPSTNTRFLGASDDEINDLGTGFDDYEIFHRVKAGEDENVESTT